MQRQHLTRSSNCRPCSYGNSQSVRVSTFRLWRWNNYEYLLLRFTDVFRKCSRNSCDVTGPHRRHILPCENLQQ